MLKNFRTFTLATQVYQGCQKLKLPYYLKDQILRSSSSVALNLSEGSGKLSLKDKRRFFSIAFASLRETQGILILAQINNNTLLDLVDKTAAHLYKLIKTCEP